MKPACVCVVLLLALSRPARGLLDDALDVLRLGREVAEEVIGSWDVIGKPLNVSGGVDLPLMRRREREVLSRLSTVTRAIDRLELEVAVAGDTALQLLRRADRGVRLDLMMHELADLLGRVSAGARMMREYVHLQQQLERVTLEEFAWWCVSHDPGALPGLLERTHALLVPTHSALGRGLLEAIAAELETEHPDLCDMQLSPHQLIYDLYNSIALTEIKGYAMMQFSWMLLRIYGKGNFTQEASLTRQRYAERTMRTATNARAALSKANRDIYRCDPPQHKEGETYAEVTRLLQGYVENEVDMNPRATCGENCAYYTLAQQYNCYDNQFCDKQKACKGRIVNCQYIDSDMKICLASPTSNRRYDWIEYENGRTFGKAGTCSRGSTKVDSWWKWNLLHCSYCFCLCEDEANDSERFFSLKEAVADHDSNKIVTGVRLVKLGRVFHVQLSEGTLLARGAVAAGGWVPLQSFDPADQGVQEGVDYHMLTYEKRAMDLDELDSPSGHVLTGVRFRMLGAHLHFEIRSTPFNYTTGQLNPGKSRWLSNDNTDVNDKQKPRSQLQLHKPDVPTRALGPQRPDSRHDQYVMFSHSDFDADAAQSTVPFIDIQPVQPMKGSTIASGAGVIHRGGKGSGGFIALKLFTYDYSRHVQAEAPPSSYVEDKETTEFTPTVN